MKQTKNTAFTLVELIVVITILAVLATVAFISFQGYTSSSRDSVRLADLKNISKSFEFMKTKDQQLPLPDQKIDISNSGTIFQYQGVLEEQTLKLSNIHNGGLDPLDGEPYGYAVNIQRNKFQLIGFLENSQTAGNNLFSQSLADNSQRFTKTVGTDLGILLDATTNEVMKQSDGITDIEMINSSTDYVLVIDTQKKGNIQSSDIVSRFLPNGSCLQLLKNGNTQSGYYTIYPDGVTETNVYCDMVTDGGGWTLNARSHDSSTACDGNFGWMKDCGSANNFSQQYSLGLNNLPDFEEILLGKQTVGSNNFDQFAYTKPVKKSELLELKDQGTFKIGSATPVLDQQCLNDGSWRSMLDGHGYSDYTGFNDNDLFWFRDGDYGSSVSLFGLRKNGFDLYGQYIGECESGMLGGEPGIIFVR